MKKLGLLLGFILLATVAPLSAKSSYHKQLQELDRTIEQREVYRSMHEQRIRSLRELLSGAVAGSEQQYNIHKRIIDLYEAYQFDSTLHYLNLNLKLAERLHSRDKRDETLLRMAHLFSTSGHYLDAAEILEKRIDTLTLNPDLLGEYYISQRRFHHERGLYARNPQIADQHFVQMGYYVGKLLDFYPAETEIHRRYLCDALIDEGNLDLAEELINDLLARTPEQSRSYAIYAYTKSLICGHRAQADEQIEWLARSAVADLQSATRDNASMCLLSQILFSSRNDVKSAFKYISTSMEDAVFYNARLRPWQISSSLPIIEEAYIAQRRLMLNGTISMSVVLLVLLIGACGLVVLEVKRKRRTELISQELKQANERLEEYITRLSEINEQQNRLNNEIREANAVKEEYIGLFLGIYSDCIDKFKEYQRSIRKRLAATSASTVERELANSHLVDEYIEEFYNTFDNAFLKLYPDFVQEFNSLLNEEARIDFRKGKSLTTELRIFALIRLGITDSSKIAALLRYSVNTIYNYRAKVKSNALISRDSFEEQIKRIGSYRNQ